MTNIELAGCIPNETKLDVREYDCIVTYIAHDETKTCFRYAGGQINTMSSFLLEKEGWLTDEAKIKMSIYNNGIDI